MKIMSVVGARPNFMKIAPFVNAIMKHNREHGNELYIEHYLVHTGQHYDARMSEAFLDALDIPRPDIDLEIGSGSHAEQVGRTMIEFEKVVRAERPDWVIVVGDVNATCACSITAKKEHVKLAHIEAGLRSFDLDMPEEINRMVTDRLSDLLFTTDEIASKNLRNEGVPEGKIRFVGNIMIDSLEFHRERASALDPFEIVIDNAIDAVEVKKIIGKFPEVFALMTMHRPSNVDEESVLRPLIYFIADEIAEEIPIFWAIHPRAMKQLEAFDLLKTIRVCSNLILLKPLGYHELLRLNMEARLVLTDSGGLQEECCILGTPCLTLRWNTERPITLRENGGASVLVGNNIQLIRTEYIKTKELQRSPFHLPLWDGKTAPRIVRELILTSGNS